MSRAIVTEATARKLHRRYVKSQRSIVDIAREAGLRFHPVYSAFHRHGLAVRARHDFPHRKRVPDERVAEMYARYQTGLTLAAVSRLYGCTGSALREVFMRRGLPVRETPVARRAHDANGCFLPHPPIAPEAIVEHILNATALKIPAALRLEWRKWPLAKRAYFVARVRARIARSNAMPATPLSENVETFHYGSPRAWKILEQLNNGRSSQAWRCKMDLCSEGLIWAGKLWFWSQKTNAYVGGPYRAGTGRPILHRAIYQAFHKVTLRPRDVVRFKDGNVNNLHPDNLVLADRNDVCRENQAVAIVAKSRAITLTLLKRSQKKESPHAEDTIHALRARKNARRAA